MVITVSLSHAFFTRYIFLHIFTSENMENTSVLVYGKTRLVNANVNIGCDTPYDNQYLYCNYGRYLYRNSR